MSAVLTLEHVKKTIKGNPIINDLSFSVQAGEIFGLLGPNGAGKTTTIRMIVGLIGLTDGDIIVSGKSVKKNFEEAVKNIGAIVENPEMYKHLTGYQNLKQYARMHKGISKEKIDEVIELVGLTERIDEKVRTYSLGMRQRLGLAQCLLHDPKLLILDEPTNGLDPAGIREFRDHLRMLTETKGMSVIVSSHLLSEMEMMCDRIAIIQQGTLTDIQYVRDFVDNDQMVYLIETGPLDNVKNWLQQDWNATFVDSGFTVSVNKEEVPLLLNRLIDSKVSVYSAKEIVKTLEQRFLEVTTHTNGGL
ncbi:ABC transporter ATP-binding protein [Aquibacillus rhizosphaerae]|uniref:ABC transporter ATP-binding protein n=1 Tax=Aquibacillus rhizosphaerae TaxID=3051431 RepID=A0ABT7L1M6_9BACI|nr:ABC transporter ATP-binding protein [Aquibacillus sp. LR5S19]MDL4839745.1 ABC transporter ATP-binding protein [Aquibacillus sp. LR5S19]